MPRRVWTVTCQGAHNPKVVGSNPTPATIESAGQGRCESAGPLRWAADPTAATPPEPPTNWNTTTGAKPEHDYRSQTGTRGTPCVVSQFGHPTRLEECVVMDTSEACGCGDRGGTDRYPERAGVRIPSSSELVKEIAHQREHRCGDDRRVFIVAGSSDRHENALGLVRCEQLTEARNCFFGDFTRKL